MLLAISTGKSPMPNGTQLPVVPEVDDDLLCRVHVLSKAVPIALYCQVFNPPPVDSLTIIPQEANHDGVICNLDAVACTLRRIVIGEQTL